MNEAGILFAVRKITIEYLKPAYFNELLKVNVKIAEIRKASILFRQSILNQDEILICEAEVRIACMNKQSMKSIPIPGYILTELKA
jgi:acyl-CoA thioester hydrolase